MKRPNITFDKDAIGAFFLQHGEKFVVALAGLAALGLTWGGIDAVRTQSATEQQRPEAILKSAGDAEAHIGREKTLPKDQARSGQPLAAAIDPWRQPKVADPPPLALLDRPLFEERAKRPQPDALPIEDLRAFAGLVVLPAKAQNPPGGDGKRPGPRGPADGGRAADAGSGQPVPGDQPQARIAPYVVVTGLIPVAKQRAEYRNRFEGVDLRDEKRDAPLWADWMIERASVGAGPEQWEKIDLVDAGRRWKTEWAGVASETVPAEFLLAPEEDRHNPKTTPPYCGPLPQRARGAWGSSGLHPWVLDQVRRRAAATPQTEPGQPAAPDAGPELFPGDPGGAAQPPGAPAADTTAAEATAAYRMFRFIDTGVTAGRAYRYRVRLALGNPNYKLDPRHLTDATAAEQPFLVSPQSNATATVKVPEPTTVLVGTLRKAEMKKLKPGWLELLVLGPSDRTGDYALRALVTEPGGLINVDEKLNKPGDKRTRGEEIRTDRVLVDVRGRQEDRADQKPARPPEPFELLCLRPDGGFEVVSTADSALLITEHAASLPPDDGGKRDGKPGQPGTEPSPFSSPFP